MFWLAAGSEELKIGQQVASGACPLCLHVQPSCKQCPCAGTVLVHVVCWCRQRTGAGGVLVFTCLHMKQSLSHSSHDACVEHQQVCSGH